MQCWRYNLSQTIRSKGDSQNVLFAILSINDDQYYELGNKNGIFLQFFSRNQFSVYVLNRLIAILSEVLVTKNSA